MTAPFTPRLSWNQPCCERCWFDQEAVWDDTEPFAPVFVSVRVPVRVTEPVVERCSWCCQPTIFGVYVRVDPLTVPFPAEKADG